MKLIRLFFTFILVLSTTYALGGSTLQQNEEPLIFIAAQTLYPEVQDETIVAWDCDDFSCQLIAKTENEYLVYQAPLNKATLLNWLAELNQDPNLPISSTNAKLLQEKIHNFLPPVSEKLINKIEQEKTVLATYGDPKSTFALLVQAIENKKEPVTDSIISHWDVQQIIDQYFDSKIDNDLFLSALQILAMMDHTGMRTWHFRSTQADFPIESSFNEWPDTIAGLYFARGGGFTYSPVTGEMPTSGYAVALPGHAYIINADRFFADHPLQEFSHKVIKEYIRKKANLLTRPHIFLGGWHDLDSDLVFLDLSEVFDELDAAIKAGIERDQIAIYDFSTGAVIPTGGSGDIPKAAGF